MQKVILFIAFLLLPLAISETELLPNNSIGASSHKSSVQKSGIHTSGCYYHTPKAVLKKICKRGECRHILDRQMDVCISKVSKRLTAGLKHNGKVEHTEYLTYNIMDDIMECMSQREGVSVSAMFPYQESFTEISHKVRSKHFEKQEKCLNKDCSRKSIMNTRPIIGETKILYYPFGRRKSWPL